MPRAREFDLDEALDLALEQFWRRGYDNTSLTDLLRSIGIHRGSLYRAFGDKHALYVAALGRYLERLREQMRQQFAEATRVGDAIEEWLHGAAQRCACADSSKGCFAVNAIVELAPRDDDVRKLLRGHLAAVEKILEQGIGRGQSQGEFAASVAAASVARLLGTLVHGLYVRAKLVRIPRQQSDELIALALASLQPADV